MSAATSDRATSSRDGGKVVYPVAGGTRIYSGLLVLLVGGYLEDGTDASSGAFAGVSQKWVDNRDGDDGDLNGEVAISGCFRFAAVGLSESDVNKPCYLLDNQTVALSSNEDLANFVYVGRIREVISATDCWVEIDPGGKDPNKVTVTADLLGTNAAAVSTAAAAAQLGGTNIFVQAVHSMEAYAVSNGASAGRKVVTTNYTIADGVLTTVTNESANRLVTSLTGILQ